MAAKGESLTVRLPEGGAVEVAASEVIRALAREGLSDPLGEVATPAQAVALAQAGLVSALDCPTCERRLVRGADARTVVFVIEAKRGGDRAVELRCSRGHLLTTWVLPT